jgi:hypothetical protein
MGLSLRKNLYCLAHEVERATRSDQEGEEDVACLVPTQVLYAALAMAPVSFSASRALEGQQGSQAFAVGTHCQQVAVDVPQRSSTISPRLKANGYKASAVSVCRPHQLWNVSSDTIACWLP